VPYEAVAVAVCRYPSTDPESAVLATYQVVTDGVEHARELVNAHRSQDMHRPCEPSTGSYDVLVLSDRAGGRLTPSWRP
jgi:hypothetical protein